VVCGVKSHCLMENGFFIICVGISVKCLVENSFYLHAGVWCGVYGVQCKSPFVPVENNFINAWCVWCVVCGVVVLVCGVWWCVG
jgi:hypothetical protein